MPSRRAQSTTPLSTPPPRPSGLTTSYTPCRPGLTWRPAPCLCLHPWNVMREQEWCHQPRPLPLPTLLTIALRSLLLQGGSRAQVTCLYHACVIKNGPLLPMCLDNKCTSTVLHNAPVQLSTLMQLAQLCLQLCELPAPVRLSPAPDPQHRHKLLQDCHLQPSPFPKKPETYDGLIITQRPSESCPVPSRPNSPCTPSSTMPRSATTEGHH